VEKKPQQNKTQPIKKTQTTLKSGRSEISLIKYFIKLAILFYCAKFTRKSVLIPVKAPKSVFIFCN